MAIEKLADPNKDWKSEHKALTMKVNIAGEEVLLAKPQTYMNLSGEAVQALMTWYKVKVDHLLVSAYPLRRGQMPPEIRFEQLGAREILTRRPPRLRRGHFQGSGACRMLF